MMDSDLFMVIALLVALLVPAFSGLALVIAFIRWLHKH